MPTEKRPDNWQQVRHAIDSGETGEKVRGFDPAVAPLGTDDEAAGTPTKPSAHEADPGGTPSAGRTAPSSSGSYTQRETTIKKVQSASSPTGELGQKYLVSGKRVSMRLWQNEQPGEGKLASRRNYETVGYVISGRAELIVEGQTIRLEAGDSWLIPAGAEHRYRILEPFTAVEATSPPAQVHGRDQLAGGE